MRDDQRSLRAFAFTDTLNELRACKRVLLSQGDVKGILLSVLRCERVNLGRHFVVLRYFAPPPVVQNAPSAFLDVLPSRSRCSISDGSTRAARDTAVSMNELNSHCNDAVITLDIVHPVSRTPFLIPLASYHFDLSRFTSSVLFSSPFPVHTRFLFSLFLPVSVISPFRSRISLRTQCFPAVFDLATFCARSEP